MKNSLIILNEFRNEIILVVRPDVKKKDDYVYMRFEKNDTSTAIYHAVKKACSLRYDYGSDSVKIEINGLASTEMSCVLSSKLLIK